MTSQINKRLAALEQAIHGDDPGAGDLIELVVIELGPGDQLVSYTERMTRQEFERRSGLKWSDPAIWVNWD